MNAYKYQKLWVWFDSTFHFECSLLCFDPNKQKSKSGLEALNTGAKQILYSPLLEMNAKRHNKLETEIEKKQQQQKHYKIVYKWNEMK